MPANRRALSPVVFGLAPSICNHELHVGSSEDNVSEKHSVIRAFLAIRP